MDPFSKGGPASWPGGNTGGIDIGNTGRPGGVPTHITSWPAGVGAVPSAIAQLMVERNKKPATFDPFGAIARRVRQIGNRLSQ